MEVATNPSTGTYHLPVRPYSPIAALNRRAAAVGSPGYVAMTEGADYNGHHVSLCWNDYRGYYIAEYFWAGRRVLARGAFADCLRAALAEYNRGALGSSLSASPREGDADAAAQCEAAGLLAGRQDAGRGDWWTWRHECAVQSVRDYAHPGAIVMHFDWPLMQAAGSREEYEAALIAKYGGVYVGHRTAKVAS